MLVVMNIPLISVPTNLGYIFDISVFIKYSQFLYILVWKKIFYEL